MAAGQLFGRGQWVHVHGVWRWSVLPWRQLSVPDAVAAAALSASALAASFAATTLTAAALAATALAAAALAAAALATTRQSKAVKHPPE